ncbi:MAG: [protein-PII] uridylyltransferase [Deltaproteobacteria bacterium]|nr:[protein-PII] uridylyltransferase [Deltaproteobacteria bacterium]MBW2659285.1 [protein-PII] uridylyltransferase [Deltaproteobacteria bacterium]
MISKFSSEYQQLEKRWRDEPEGVDFVREYSLLVDRFLGDCLRSVQPEVDGGSVALVAIGGYGRQELYPGSDIDLMILYRAGYEEVGRVADGVLYPLWDAGLEVGHGVRSVAESIDHATEEYYFRVALLDARLVCGSKDLFEELNRLYATTFVDGRREEFVTEMKKHRLSRRARFGTHSYLLEPNIKEGRGGMRDIQAMLWTAQVVFGLNGFEDMCRSGLLLDEEWRDFKAALEMLIRLRIFLHFLSKRKNDQLYFEQQEEVAVAFGYRAGDGVLAVEDFMRDVYSCLQTVSVITDLFFDHVDEVLGLLGGGPIVPDKVVEKGIEIRKGKVHLTARSAQLQEKPNILIRLFLVMARTGLPLHHGTRKMISGYLYLIDDKVRSSSRFAKTFFSILSEAVDIFAVLEMMLETGLLPVSIPEFARIITLVQYDVYHIYTVDRHSLQTVAELKVQAGEMERVLLDVKSQQVLYLAALLHDIGKGAGRDHSVEGAGLAVAAGKRFGLSGAECDSLEFLVRYHLFIPENALRRDLSDTLFIQRCAETIGSLDRLSMLYLISVADSRATGPSAWSEWKAALMEELYYKVYARLDLDHRGEAGGSVSDEEHVGQGVEWLRSQVDEILAGERDVRMCTADLSADYLLSFSPEIAARHLCIHRDHYQLLRQKSLIRVEEDGECWSLLVMAVDKPGLLAKICGVMALNNLAVVRAQIFTWADGTAVDVLDVKPVDGLGCDEKDWQMLNNDLDKAISHRLGLGHRLHRKLASAYTRRRELTGEVATKVLIDNKSSEVYSIIEVYSADLPGQLYHIAQMLADFGMDIHKAYVATEVGQLIDVFYVLDDRGEKVDDAEFQQEIIHGLLHSVDYSVS